MPTLQTDRHAVRQTGQRFDSAWRTALQTVAQKTAGDGIRFGTLNAEPLIKPFCKSNDETNKPVIKAMRVIMLLIKLKKIGDALNCCNKICFGSIVDIKHVVS